MIIELILNLTALAVIVEVLTDIVKGLIPEIDSPVPVPVLVSTIIGVTIGILTRADVFIALGLEATNPYISYILTGILLSGGSKIIHEIVAKVRSSRADIEVLHETKKAN